MSLSNKSYEELEKASLEWSKQNKKVIVLEEGKKLHILNYFLNIN